VFTECQGGPCSSETTGDGAPYSSQFGSFRSAEIQFGTATNFNWHPFDQHAFGANLSGLLRVESNALYTFTLTSDDGSTLYIDGTPVVGVPEPHSPFSASGIVRLAAGIHSFEVHFFECCSGHSGVDLTLPSGVTYVSEEDCED
jgi:hypothetical protein